MKANYKWLKAVLASGVRKLSMTFLVVNLGEFILFDGFLDLDNFQLSDILVFGFISFDLLLSLISLTSLAASTSTPSNSLAASTYNDIIVFSIDVSGAAILLNFWINY